MILPVDALFNSVSAMTMTGLATVNLSGLTGWQQAILYLQMIAGNIVGQALVHILLHSGYLTVRPCSGHCIMGYGHSAQIFLQGEIQAHCSGDYRSRARRKERRPPSSHNASFVYQEDDGSLVPIAQFFAQA